MPDIALLGASGFARQVAWCGQRDGAHDVIAYVDETLSAVTVIDGIPVMAGVNDLPTGVSLIAAVGDPGLRRRWAREHGTTHRFTSVTDPMAVIAPDAQTGMGCVIFAGVVLSTQVVVGDHTILGFNTALSHEASVGSFSHLASGVILNGRSRVGHGCLIGAGAILLPDVHVGDNAIVGAGALVTKDVAPGSTVAGVPARRLRTPKP